MLWRMHDTVGIRPFFEISGSRSRLLPAVVAVAVAGLLMEGMLRLGRVPAKWLYQHGPVSWDDRVWIYVGLAILFQAALGFIGIAVMKKILPKADANLRWPPGPSLAGLAFAIGVGMALVMLEAMKMENIIKSVSEGEVKSILVAVGNSVEKNQVLIHF